MALTFNCLPHTNLLTGINNVVDIEKVGPPVCLASIIEWTIGVDVGPEWTIAEVHKEACYNTDQDHVDRS